MRAKLIMTSVITGVLVLTGSLFAASITKKATASHPSSHKKRQYTIRTLGRSFIDLPPAGSSAGDRVAFDNPLYDRSNTKELGSSRGECVQVGESQTVYHCLAVFVLPEGQITTQGIADFANAPATVAITGGSGEYQKVTGQAIFSEINPTTDGLTIELK
jgi:allene oxide cyclase